MQSEKWSSKRLQRLEMDNYMCRTCNSKENLEIHHVTYRNFGNENMEDLITLCKDCHEAITNVIRNKRYDKKEVSGKEYKTNRPIEVRRRQNEKMEKIELQDYRRSTPFDAQFKRCRPT